MAAARRRLHPPPHPLVGAATMATGGELHDAAHGKARRAGSGASMAGSGAHGDGSAAWGGNEDLFACGPMAPLLGFVWAAAGVAVMAPAPVRWAPGSSLGTAGLPSDRRGG